MEESRCVLAMVVSTQRALSLGHETAVDLVRRSLSRRIALPGSSAIQSKFPGLRWLVLTSRPLMAAT